MTQEKEKKTFWQVWKEIEYFVERNWRVEEHRIAIERLIALQVQHMALIVVALFYLFFGFYRETKEWYAHVPAILSFFLLLIGSCHLLWVYYHRKLYDDPAPLGTWKEHYEEWEKYCEENEKKEDSPSKMFLSNVVEKYLKAIDVGEKVNKEKTKMLHNCRKYFALSFVCLILYVIYFVISKI